MGYSTDFEGTLKLSKNLTEEQLGYINCFSETRRMGRDPEILMKLYKGKHGLPYAFKLPPGAINPIEKLKKMGLSVEVTPIGDRTAKDIYGVDGEYFAYDDGHSGQSTDNSIRDFNNSSTMPGLWCQWIVSPFDGKHHLVWNDGEKFYNYVEWLKFMIKHFFEPWGIKLTGDIDWFGEERTDIGRISCLNNTVVVKSGSIEYEK